MKNELETGLMIPDLLETLDVKIGCIDKAMKVIGNMMDLEIELKNKINLLEAENLKLKEDAKRTTNCNCNKPD